MTESDREFLTKQLFHGRDTLLGAIEGLSNTQWHFKPAEGSWSIAECVEHLAVTEESMLGLITKGSVNPEGVPSTPEKDGRMVAGVLDRNRKFLAPEHVRPAARFPSADEARSHFLAGRERSIVYARGSDADLRRLFAKHPLLGEIDCYRFLLLLALHPARHAAQIEEIRRHPEFPI